MMISCFHLLSEMGLGLYDLSFFQLLFSRESVFYIIFFEQLQESKHLVSLELDKDDTIKNNQCHKGDHSCKKIFGKVGLSLTRQDKY